MANLATSSSSSSMTSTSHTMTAFPATTQPHCNASTSPAIDVCKALAAENRHVFLTPGAELPNASLQFAKTILDALAPTLSEEQSMRLWEARRKRKRGWRPEGDGEVLKVRKLHTEGFEVEQVWEQARRVIDALRVDAERGLRLVGRRIAAEGEASGFAGAEAGLDKNRDDSRSADGSAMDEEDLGLDSNEGNHFESALEDENGTDEANSIDGNGFEDDDIADLVNGEEEVEEGEGEGEEIDEDDDVPGGVYVADPHGLDDGFFSIDDFNRQTEFLEQADSRADPYTGEASDEEDIDWDADPSTIAVNATSTTKPSSSRKNEEERLDDDDDDNDDDDEDGPTFGNMDLNAPEGDSGAEDDGSRDENLDITAENANDILYKDFFEPPPRKISKGERQANYLQRQSERSKPSKLQDEETEIQRAISDVRRDLFDDASSRADSSDALSDLDPADPKSRKSAHERRLAKVGEEIRRLEAASVAKRQWTLSGEARAADRPMNSLIEEDLDFERTGKPVPVITAEISESIEELIKRRILAQEFDEVVKRRPDATDHSNPRRGLFELDDTKAKQSLAEMYEEDHIKASNPDTYVSKTDEKLRKEESEVVALWADVSAKLDALSSWHYTPKPTAPSLTVVADVATISMEDAQPATASGLAGSGSRLAPQEVYKAGKRSAGGAVTGGAGGKGEVMLKSGVPVAREEMTRDQKVRRRRREKERIRKAGGLVGTRNLEGKKEKEKRETVTELKRSGVKVIGKKGDVTDVEGNKVKTTAGERSGASFKL